MPDGRPIVGAPAKQLTKADQGRQLITHELATASGTRRPEVLGVLADAGIADREARRLRPTRR